MSGFRGNESLKPANSTESISKEEFENRLREIIRCKNDPVYFANTYFKIINLERGLQQITLFPKQEEFLRFIVNNDRVIAMTPRQSSKSTTYTIYSLWYTIFHPEKKVLLACNKLETALEMMGRISLAYENLPNWIKPGLMTLNKGELVFDNLSSIKGLATSSSAARGYSANVLILDEFAFCMPNVADSFFTSVYPVISSAKGTKVIIVSTPNGVGNLYYDIYQQALTNVRSTPDQSSITGWKPFRMEWYEVPGRDDNWKAQQIASIGIDRWRQEFGNEFITSTFKKLIPAERIESFRLDLIKYKKTKFPCEILSIMGQNAEYEAKIWYDFDKSKTYLASADVADGVGKDSSVIYIWDITDYDNIKQAAMFSSSSIPVVEFAYVCFKLMSRYCNPFFICESNSIGRSLFDQLITIYNYENFIVLDKRGKPGVYSHLTIKSKACLWAQEFLMTPEIKIEIHDENLIDDMDSFVKKDKGNVKTPSYAALPNSHDDHMMAMIWAMYVLMPENLTNYYQTIGVLTTKLGKSFPKEVYPTTPYDTSASDRKHTYINSLGYAEKWSEYLKGLEDESNASKDYQEILSIDGKKFQPKKEVETDLDKLIREREAAQPKAIEEQSLFSYGDPYGFRQKSIDKDKSRFFVDIGGASLDPDLFFQWNPYQ